ncbi:hypothetical protein IAR55_000560 [Kwoniella newhampshirensis]|uniref:Uncharacterized protein n=1 Tax=Kwoniella newhampshirensis TaxID=1651941 RepID=A0AAW0Z728_9TREE
MFGYYTSMPRRKSSMTNNTALPRSSVYSSSTTKGPASPSSPTSPNLGSPFSLSFGRHTPTSPNTPPNNNGTSPPAHRTDAGTGPGSGGSRSPLVSARDFGMPSSEAGPGPSTLRSQEGRRKEYPQGTEERTQDEQGADRSRSRDSFVILQDHEAEEEDRVDENQFGGEHGGADGGEDDDDDSPPASTSLSRNHFHSFPDPSLIPPASVHDPYISAFIRPLETSPLETSPPGGLGDVSRPTMHRSSSAPGHPASQLLPSALPSNSVDGPVIGLVDEDERPNRVENDQDDDEDGGSSTGGGRRGKQPIFEIFNASLSSDGSKMSNDLRGYLETVLKGQEEVAKLHLDLEDLGLGLGYTSERDSEEGEKKMKEDGEQRLDKREKGVEEIMRRLDSLSQSLRTYHHLGTPKLSFSHNNPQGSRNKSRTQSMDPTTSSSSSTARPSAPVPSSGGPSQPTPPINELSTASPSRQASSRHTSPAYVRSNTAVGEVSPRKRNRSPLIHILRPELSDDTQGDGGIDQADLEHHADNERRRGPSLSSAKETKAKEDQSSFWRLGQEKEGRHGWFENVAEGSGRQKGEDMEIVTSPIEMTDRSRFW